LILWVRRDNPAAQTILSAAAAKIVELNSQINELRRCQQRTISAKQWKTMFDLLNFLPDSDRGHIQLTTYHDNAEARRYCQEFAEFLFHLNLCSGTGILDGPPDAVGLVLRFDSKKPRPMIVERFSEALTLAGLRHKVRSFDFPPEMLAGQCELVVGKAASQ
jgi:hypothetical protein